MRRTATVRRPVDLVHRVMRKLIGGSVSAAAAVVLGAFGLFWLGVALHHVLLPEVGTALAWAIPGALYVLLAALVATLALRPEAGSAPEREQAAGFTPFPMDAGQLGLELGRGLEREVRRHPLRAVSFAMLGGAVLGASPELRRSLVGLLRGHGNGETGR